MNIIITIYTASGNFVHLSVLRMHEWGSGLHGAILSVEEYGEVLLPLLINPSVCDLLKPASKSGWRKESRRQELRRQELRR